MTLTTYSFEVKTIVKIHADTKLDAWNKLDRFMENRLPLNNLIECVETTLMSGDPTL